MPNLCYAIGWWQCDACMHPCTTLRHVAAVASSRTSSSFGTWPCSAIYEKSAGMCATCATEWTNGVPNVTDHEMSPRMSCFTDRRMLQTQIQRIKSSAFQLSNSMPVGHLHCILQIKVRAHGPALVLYVKFLTISRVLRPPHSTPQCSLLACRRCILVVRLTSQIL